ncbi:phage protein Gp13 family protein [Pseudomonas syringae]|uniref:phage protein Gp13 family protein n=1 Tax=Pseudomonas syringae TaxID=317 RepID=UPI003F74D15B
MLIIKANLADLVEAANNLSANDLADLNAMKAGRAPADVFCNALDETTQAIKIRGRVLAVGGHLNGGVWFVTTTLVSALPLAERFRFYRMLKNHLSKIKAELPRGMELTNCVSVGNRAHVKLLEKLGATFQDGYVVSPAGFPFKQFWL